MRIVCAPSEFYRKKAIVLKKPVKVGAVLGIAASIFAIAVVVGKFLADMADAFSDDEGWDEECADDAADTLSPCDEAYDRGYSHGIHGLPYAGKNSVALAFQDIMAAETMAMYDEIVQENLQEGLVGQSISSSVDDSRSSRADYEDRGNAYNEAGRLGSASE